MSGYDAVHPKRVKRKIPLDAICHLLLTGRLLQVGIIPLFVGLALVYCTLPTIQTAILLKGHLLTAQGYVYLSHDTLQTRNSLPVYENRYRFVASNGRTYQGVSFGQHEDPTGSIPVNVRYSKSHPNVSVIEGMRATNHSLGLGAFAMIPLFVGLILVIGGLFENLNIFVVLRSGEAGVAVLEDKIQTKKFVNQHSVYRYVYTFTTPSGKLRRMTVNTFEWLDESQPVLYNPGSNEFCALVVGMPGKLTLANGEITAQIPLFQTLIVPIVAVMVALGIVAAMK